MDKIENQYSALVVRYARWVIKKKWTLALLAIVLAFAAGSGGRFLAFNNDYHTFFAKDNPQVMAFDALQEKYTKDENVFIVIEPTNGNVFTRETLSAITDFEQRAWQTPFSSRVDALSNYQHTRSEGDDMFVESLVGDVTDISDAELASIREIALGEPLLVNRLVDKDASVTAVNITINLPDDDPLAGMDVMYYVRNMVEEWETDHPGHNTYLSGILILNGAFAEGSMNDMQTLIPIMFLVILSAVFMTTRSISGMLVSFIILLFSIMTAMGLAGWMGIELSAPSSGAPTMIMTLAIADTIHLLVTMFQLMRNGVKKEEAIVESVRVNFVPILLTSITTIIGFLTLNFVEGSPFHDLGNITAMGVTAAFIFSIVLVPALMAILPVNMKEGEESNTGGFAFLDRLGEFVIANHKNALAFSIVAVLGLSAMALNNELNNEFVKFFDKSVKFRTDTDFISENLTGIYSIEYSLGTGESDGISNPNYLKKLDEFDQWFREQDEVMHVNTFSETIKRVNASMHSDDVNYYRVPDAKNETAQYILLYEMSLPYGLDLNNQINVDKSETRFTVTLKNISSNEMMALSSRAEQWLRDNAPDEMHAIGASPTLMFSHITKTNMDSMLKSGFGALIIISFILIYALKSWKYGLVSLVPNITPIAVAFGIWGITTGQINMAVAVVLGMTLGIVVDDTIHFLTKYIRARKEKGKSPEDAIRYTFSTVGRAIVVTSIILTSGFMVLTQSSFGFNSGMGKLTAITIMAALLLDLLLVPALLLMLDKKEPGSSS